MYVHQTYVPIVYLCLHMQAYKYRMYTLSNLSYRVVFKFPLSDPYVAMPFVRHCQPLRGWNIMLDILNANRRQACHGSGLGQFEAHAVIQHLKVVTWKCGVKASRKVNTNGTLG